MEFNCKDDESLYWKDRAEHFQNELLNVQDEFRTYELSSKELEQELELQLDDYEAKNKNLIIKNEKLNTDYENLQFRLTDATKVFNCQIIELQDELNRVKCDKLTLQKYIRELEQTNDDLERSQRATVTSLQDFEHKLNIALEKNAILENELDEKEALVETVQRLKDEARDLRQDLQVKDLHINQVQNNMSQKDKDALATSLIEERSEPPKICHSSVAMQTDVYIQSNNASMPNGTFDHNSSTSLNHRSSSGQLSYHRNSHLATTPISQMPLTPAARISALSLVSDMLKKVGAIELKLSSAAQRGLADNDGNYLAQGARTPGRHRMSESAVLNGYNRQSMNDSFDGPVTTPVTSPIRPVNGLSRTSSRPVSQAVVAE